MNKKILVIVPSYNEEDSIGSLLDEIKSDFPDGDILVINDGSTDNTLDTCKDANVEVLDFSVNLGIGWALKAGFLYAHKWGYDICVLCDGDGQHIPSQIPSLIEPIRKGKADVTIGSRNLGYGNYRASVLRRLGNIIFSKIMSFVTIYQISDTTSGFRAFNKTSLTILSEHFLVEQFSVNTILICNSIKLRLEEVPTKMRQREYGESAFKMYRYPVELLLHLLTILVFRLSKKEYKKTY